MSQEPSLRQSGRFVRRALTAYSDRTLGPAAPGLDFSGVFEGSIVEGGQSGTAAQVKFVRDGHLVQGSYLLGEICGSISGAVTRDRLEFSWRRAGNSGHGIGSQIADRVSGTFGLGEDAKGGGTFVLIQRRAGSPTAALGQSSSIWDTVDAAALNQQVTQLYIGSPPAALGQSSSIWDTIDAATLNQQVTQLYNQGRYSEAIPLAQRALAILEKARGPDHPDVANSLNNLARLYSAQGRYFDAELFHKRSLAILEKAFGPDHPDVAASLNNLAEVYHAQGRYADAEPLFKRSLTIKEKAFGPDHPDVALSLNNLAELYGAQGRYADALPIVQRTISQNSANKSVALPVLFGSQSGKLLTSAEALNASFTVFQRSVSSAAGEAVSKLSARFAAGTNELAQLVRKDQDLTAEADRLDKSIIAAVSKPPAERNKSAEDQIRKRIEEIKSERDKLQDVFNQRFPDYVALSKPQPLTIEQTQTLLADDEALVTIDLDKNSYVWVITKERAEWKELTVSAEDVSKSVETLRSGLNPDAQKPLDRNLAYQLYHQVLGPIEDIMSQKKRLSFVLDRALTSLPPQVMIISDPNGKDFASLDWLIRKYAVTVLPSIASLKILRGEKSIVAAINPMIGFGDPVFDRTTQAAGRPKVAALNRSLTSFYRGVTADTKALAEALPALPETADELRAIGKILGAKSEDIKLGEAASVTTVKKEPLAN
jgi:tetratricopeptide (TPR) repeat protein